MVAAVCARLARRSCRLSLVARLAARSTKPGVTLPGLALHQAGAAVVAAAELARSDIYQDHDNAFVTGLAAFIGKQAARLAALAREAATIPASLH